MKSKTTRGVCYTLYADDGMRQNVIGEYNGIVMHLNTNENEEPGKLHQPNVLRLILSLKLLLFILLIFFIF